MSLECSKNAVVKGFSNFEQHKGSFADDVLRTPEERIEEIFTIANRCRGWYEPIYADQSNYLPVSKKAAVVVADTKPPIKMVDVNNDLLKLLLVGAGVFIIIKILS